MKPYDCVIIGSGPAGLGAAFEILKRHPNASVFIVEKSEVSTGGLRNDCKMNFTYPIGFPLGANTMMDRVWFSVFLAWVIKRAVLKFGGAGLYQRSQAFFLGLIAGQALCSGLWLVIDYFTGKVGNPVFHI